MPAWVHPGPPHPTRERQGPSEGPCLPPPAPDLLTNLHSGLSLSRDVSFGGGLPALCLQEVLLLKSRSPGPLARFTVRVCPAAGGLSGPRSAQVLPMEQEGTATCPGGRVPQPGRPLPPSQGRPGGLCLRTPALSLPGRTHLGSHAGVPDTGHGFPGPHSSQHPQHVTEPGQRGPGLRLGVQRCWLCPLGARPSVGRLGPGAPARPAPGML